MRRARRPMVTALSIPSSEQVVELARDLYRRLGGGWSPTIYRDALALLLGEAGIATCAGAAIGVAPCLASDLVVVGGLVVRVVGVGRPAEPLTDCLACTGLSAGLLLRFGGERLAATEVAPAGGVEGPPAGRAAVRCALEPSTPMEGRGRRAVA